MKAPIGHAKRMREAQKQERIRKAAPALLEALQELSSAYELLCHQIDENPNVNMHYRSAIAAIAAARGDL